MSAGSLRDGGQQLSAESSVRSVSTVASRSGAAGKLPSLRPTGNWGAAAGPGRPSGMPGSSRRGYRPSTSTRRTTSSRAGDAVIDPFAPIKVIDDQGVNRTPQPLVAIVTSAALRQARYLGMQESVVGSETSEALLGEVSSTAFGRGWFDSVSVTPQESSNDLDYSPSGGRMLAQTAAAVMGDASGNRALRGTNSGSNKSQSGFSLLTSQRPTHTPPESGDGSRGLGADAADTAVLSESDLAACHDVILQDSGTIVMLDMPGIVVSVDTPEGSQVVAANQRYSQALADASSSDKHSSSCSQTPVVLLKHKEVQSGSSSNQTVACQASGYDIHDSYAVLNKDQGDEGEEQLGSVLPSGAVMSAGNSGSGNQSSSLSASFMRSSTQQFRPSSVSSMRSSSMAGWGEGRSTFSRPASSRGSDRGGAAADGHAAAVALMAAQEAQEEPWTQLPGISEVLEVMEAAVSQNIYLPQLMLYRDIKPPPPLVVSFDLGTSAAADGLSAVPSLTGAGSGQLNLASPGPNSRPSLCSTPGSSRPTGEQPWSTSHTPHGGSNIGHSGAHGSLAGMSNPSMSGARPSMIGGMSMSGLGPGGLLSRRPSCQVGHDLGSGPSRQSSIMSMGSSRVFRSNRPHASLQQLWTWSCSVTEGRPVSSMAWNGTNNNLLAAGYGSRQPAESAAAGAASGSAGGPGVSAFAQGQQASMIGQGALLSAPRGAAGDAAADAAGGAAAPENGSAGGCVALWSLKNQFYPICSFSTKAGVTSLDFSQRNPHMLGVGMHDGTIAVYDVRSRQASPVLASTAETGKHADPIWKVRWVDPGPEREEQLVSISTDGKVKAWTVAKGLEHNTLITLKRVPHRLVASAGSSRGSNGGALSAGAAAGAGAVPAGSGAKAAATVAALRGDGSGSRGAVISRNTGGMSFDFSSTDRRMYLAGTEDGHIHKCSTSYSEQYLETYHGHIGPVFALQWSPFNPSLFLSCSGDWTIRMWQEGRQQPLMTFQSSNKEVLDVAWCPSNSTVFAAVTADGRLEVWDFAVSTMRPVCQHAVTKTSMTALLFAQDAPVIVSATDAGVLQVYRLVNIAADRFEPPELQHARLEEALRANIMKAALAGS